MHTQNIQPLKNDGILDLGEQEYKDSTEALELLIKLHSKELQIYGRNTSEQDKQQLERFTKCKDYLKVGQQKINRSIIRDTINGVNELIRKTKKEKNTEKILRLKNLMKEYQKVKKEIMLDRIREKNIK
ncbi:MAG: hypothetical protein ACPKPY_05510 [Nitrososphaeraceae archaeon]